MLLEPWWRTISKFSPQRIVSNRVASNTNNYVVNNGSVITAHQHDSDILLHSSVNTSKLLLHVINNLEEYLLVT